VPPLYARVGDWVFVTLWAIGAAVLVARTR
jgi:hypothetical protein